MLPSISALRARVFIRYVISRFETLIRPGDPADSPNVTFETPSPLSIIWLLNALTRAAPLRSIGEFNRPVPMYSLVLSSPISSRTAEGYPSS